jgi:hypothetical protein
MSIDMWETHVFLLMPFNKKTLIIILMLLMQEAHAI